MTSQFFICFCGKQLMLFKKICRKHHQFLCLGKRQKKRDVERIQHETFHIWFEEHVSCEVVYNMIATHVFCIFEMILLIFITLLGSKYGFE